MIDPRRSCCPPPAHVHRSRIWRLELGGAGQPSAAEREQDARQWAQEEFGHARLGDIRRTRRLVRIAAHAAHQPSALITRLCANAPRELDAAYDFFENGAVSSDAIFQAHAEATARRCREHSFVFLAVDGSSVQLSDPDGERGTGRVGTHTAGARGIKTMLGLALSPAGVPLGVLGQCLWQRSLRPPTKSRSQRAVHEKETQHWLTTIQQAEQVRAEHAPDVTLWPQLDREGDSWPVLLDAVEASGTRWTTVRARADRRLWRDPEGQDDTAPGGKLLDQLEAQPVQATYELDVPAGPARRARTAQMTLRWVEVTLALRDKRTSRTCPAPLFALLAEEQGSTPEGEKPLCWLLLTTYELQTVDDACLVLFGYSLRWRIELLHAALKERGCQVEDSQLGHVRSVERLLAVLVPVAVRLVRLVFLARKHPDRPATDELSPVECQALGLAFEADEQLIATLTMSEAVEMLGKLGGHVGDPRKRPIGFKVLARGLQELRPWVRIAERGYVRPPPSSMKGRLK